TPGADAHYIAAKEGSAPMELVALVAPSDIVGPTYTYAHRVRGTGSHTFRVWSADGGLVSTPVQASITVSAASVPDATATAERRYRTMLVRYQLPDDGRVAGATLKVWSGPAEAFDSGSGSYVPPATRAATAEAVASVGGA